MMRTRHLKDDQLFACYLATRSGELPDPRDGEHLTECDECTARYAALTADMEDLRADADVRIDELYAAERLEAQQEQILRRLEHVHRPARVISFPPREAATSVHASHVPPRWLAAAAAAGLFIGVAVGGFLGPNGSPSAPSMQVATTPGARVQAAPSSLEVTTSFQGDDDAFLQELEVALESPQLRELEPIDVMTPHVREVATVLR